MTHHEGLSKLGRAENAQVIIDVHWVKSMLDIDDAGRAGEFNRP